MKNIIKIGNILRVAMLIAILSGSAHATHDNGQGKSRDNPNPLDSVSVAPEPSTFWLFLAGALGIAAFNRYKNAGVRVKCQGRNSDT